MYMLIGFTTFALAKLIVSDILQVVREIKEDQSWIKVKNKLDAIVF